jgi:dTDP-4-dehydrorhamnose 3,5-epimerase
MKYRRTAIEDVVVFEPQKFTDERGFFVETYRSSWFDELGIAPVFVQDNHSQSQCGTLRGLHLQTSQTQGKLIRVACGEVFNVVVDLRLESPTYGQWVSEYLSAENALVLWVPPGFANGFVTLSATADLLYKCTNYYVPQSEMVFHWNSPVLNIDWPLPEGASVCLSNKDQQAKHFTLGQGFDRGVWQEAK